MGGWDHRGTTTVDSQSAAWSARNARYGLALFALYCAAYALFVGLNAFVPDFMTKRPWAGISLSVLYGLGLILLAFVLALVYAWICRLPPAEAVATDGTASTAGDRA